MITKILELILYLINFIISKIIQLVMLAFPSFGLAKIYTVFDSFFGLMEGAFNMTYFIFGPLTYVFSDIIITLFTIKHIVIPVISFVRKFFVK